MRSQSIYIRSTSNYFYLLRTVKFICLSRPLQRNSIYLLFRNAAHELVGERSPVCAHVLSQSGSQFAQENTSSIYLSVSVTVDSTSAAAAVDHWRLLSFCRCSIDLSHLQSIHRVVLSSVPVSQSLTCSLILSPEKTTSRTIQSYSVIVVVMIVIIIIPLSGVY